MCITLAVILRLFCRNPHRTTCDDPEIAKYKATLTLNVPYRFQAPFMPDFRGNSWNRISNIISRVNSDKDLIYHFGSGTGLNRTIEISDKWAAYLSINQAIIAICWR